MVKAAEAIESPPSTLRSEGFRASRQRPADVMWVRSPGEEQERMEERTLPHVQ